MYLINNTIKCRLLILFTVTLDFGLESATVVAAAAAAAATAAARPWDKLVWCSELQSNVVVPSVQT